MKDLTKGSITKLIGAFALPVLIGNILQLTYNLVDTKIVSQVLGEDALAAVGATNSLNSLVIGFLFGLTNGFAVIAARSFGAKDIKELKKVAGMSLSLGLITSAIMTCLVLVFLKPLLRVLNTPEHIIGQSYDYIFIIFAGMSVMMLYNVCCALLRAIGDTITPLLFLAASVILNIGGDFLLMVTIPMGVQGAAIATVLSQCIALVACMFYMFKRYEILRFSFHDLNPDWKLIHQLFASGLSMGFMSSLVSFGTVALQTSINTFGTEIIVAHTAARKITELYMLAFAVLGTTMATFCGQNLGAGKVERIKVGIKIAVGITWVWSLGVIIVTYTLAPAMISALTSTDKTEIIQTAVLYLRIDTVFYFVPAMITVIRNAMQGIGDHITPIVSSFIELTGKVLIVILLVPHLQYMGIILAEPIVWILMVIPLLIRIINNPILKKVKSRIE
jgi:putative MATE family efflux protein